MSARDKSVFWDTACQQGWTSADPTVLWSFLEATISENDNCYFCIQAAKIVGQGLLLDRIPPRKVLNLYLDKWIGTNNFLLELIRIRTLALLYMQSPSEIMTVLTAFRDDDNADIASEAMFQCGCISLIKCQNETDKDTISSILKTVIKDMNQAVSIAENRMDAMIVATICGMFSAMIQNEGIDHTVAQKLRLQCRIYAANSLTHHTMPWFISLAVSLFELLDSAMDKPDGWCNFSAKIEELGELVAHTLASQFAETTTVGIIESLIMHTAVNKWMTPLWQYDFKHEGKRIEIMLTNHGLNDSTLSFLRRLEDLQQRQTANWCEEVSCMMHKNGIPTTPEDIQQIAEKLVQGDSIAAIETAFMHANVKETKDIIEDILECCAALQSSYNSFRSTDENDRNTYIRDLLEMKKYVIRDQHLQGISAGGKRAGEVDLCVSWCGITRTIIEALNVDSLNTAYITDHINKTFGYDTLGLSFLVLVIYVTVTDYTKFFQKYLSWISTQSFSCQLVEEPKCLETKHTGIDLRLINTKHKRSGSNFDIYHIVMLLPSIEPRDSVTQ